MKNLHFNFSFILAIVASSFILPSSNNQALAVDNPTAQVDYFLEIDGIKGESTDAKHYGWIDVLSAQVDKSKRTVTIVRKVTPLSSPQLKRLSESGEQLNLGILDEPATGMRIKMKPVYVSSYQTSSSGSYPIETFTLNYIEIK